MLHYRRRKCRSSVRRTSTFRCTRAPRSSMRNRRMSLQHYSSRWQHRRTVGRRGRSGIGIHTHARPTSGCTRNTRLLGSQTPKYLRSNRRFLSKAEQLTPGTPPCNGARGSRSCTHTYRCPSVHQRSTVFAPVGTGIAARIRARTRMGCTASTGCSSTPARTTPACTGTSPFRECMCRARPRSTPPRS